MSGNILLAWILGIVMLAVEIIVYIIFMPILEYLVYFTTTSGAPASAAFFLLVCARWGFSLIGVVCVLYPFIYTWKIERDQGQEGVYYR